MNEGFQSTAAELESRDTLLRMKETASNAVAKSDLLAANNTLLLIILSLLIIFSVVIPLLFFRKLKKAAKISEQKISDQLDIVAESLKNALSTEIPLSSDIVSEVNFSIDRKMRSYDRKLAALEQASRAGIYYMHAMTSIGQKNYVAALIELLTAAKNYNASRDSAGLKKSLAAINQCLHHMSIKHADDIKANSADMKELLLDIRNSGDQANVADIVKELKGNWDKLTAPVIVRAKKPTTIIPAISRTRPAAKVNGIVKNEIGKKIRSTAK